MAPTVRIHTCGSIDAVAASFPKLNSRAAWNDLLLKNGKALVLTSDGKRYRVESLHLARDAECVDVELKQIGGEEVLKGVGLHSDAGITKVYTNFFGGGFSSSSAEYTISTTVIG